jgi:hypothetical protein
MKRLVALVFAIAAAGCQQQQSTAVSRPAAPAGVSVDTGTDVLPLSAFSMGIAHQLPVRNTPTAVPKLQEVKAFIVNVPNTSPGDVKLYWVRDLDLIFSASQEPIQAEVKQNGSTYEIAPPEVPEKGGYLMLVIGSPNGGPSRYYAVARG